MATRVTPEDGTDSDGSGPAYISAVGIFAATVSTSAATIGSGTFVVFNQGLVTRGTLDIVPNPSDRSVSGIFEDSLLESSGVLDARLVNRTPLQTRVVTAGIRGTAQIRFTNPLLETVEFDVFGYQTTL